MLNFALQLLATFAVSLVAFAGVFALAKQKGYIRFASQVEAHSSPTANISDALRKQMILISASSPDLFDSTLCIDTSGRSFDFESSSKAVGWFVDFESTARDLGYIAMDGVASHQSKLEKIIPPALRTNATPQHKARSPNTLCALAA